MSHPPKKKKVDEPAPILPHDAGQKPIQLQRRRVWRACESCRRKKIKCDGNEPICSQCTASRVQCTWLQTKDRAALSRHYVQELEARLLHMEDLFKQVAPMIEKLDGNNSNGILSQIKTDTATAVDVERRSAPRHPSRSLSPRHKKTPSESSASPSPMFAHARPGDAVDDEGISESFGQLALDEHGHLRWIGGSSTMSLIQSFRSLTTSPFNRTSPMEEDPHSPGPSANKLYFPASVFFGKVHALPGAEEVEYPDRDLADKLVDTYFKKFHFLLPVLDKPSFMSHYRHLMDHHDDVHLVRSQAAFVALVFAVFACAARMADDERLQATSSDDGGMGMIYYERALVLHYISHASIQIAHVQCFVLLSSFLCSVNCLPQAWLLVGQAVRMGQDLGLHRQSRHLTLSPIEKETRRKVWWCVYTLDRMLALALGRPLGVEDSDCDAECPVDHDDEDLPEYFSGAQLAHKQPSLMKGFIALVELYRIAGRVCRQIFGIDKCRDNLEPEVQEELLESVTALDKELTEWCETLPAAFKSAPTTEMQVSLGAVLCSHYYSILTTLHRNFLPIKEARFSDPTSTAKAVASARSCICLAPSVRNVVPLSHHLAFFIQNLFSSAVILMLYAMHISDAKAARAAMEEAVSCMDVLSAWEGRWPGARKCKDLLSDLAANAKEAIADGTMQRLQSSMSPPPPSPIHSRSVSVPRPMKNKPSRRKSHGNASPARPINFLANRSPPTRSASGPQKRGREELDQLRSRGPGPFTYHHTFSSTYGGQSEPMSPSQPVASTSTTPSFTPDSKDSNRGGPFMGSQAFDGQNGQSATLPFSYDYNLASGSQASNGISNMFTPGNGVFFGANPNQASNIFTGAGGGYQNPTSLEYLSYPSSSTQDSAMGSTSATTDTPPTSAFAEPGLPFPGLDFIRNFNPGGFGDEGHDQQDALWRSFDAGEFKYDPDLQFTFGEFLPDAGGAGS